MIALLLLALLLSPNTPRPPMVTCRSCSTSNEPFRTTCRNCGANL